MSGQQLQQKLFFHSLPEILLSVIPLTSQGQSVLRLYGIIPDTD